MQLFFYVICIWVNIFYILTVIYFLIAFNFFIIWSIHKFGLFKNVQLVIKNIKRLNHASSNIFFNLTLL